MSNLYESSSYNILSVYRVYRDNGYDGTYLVKLQRLPISTYPEPTEIFLTTEQISLDLAQSDWIAQAIPFIDSELSSYDSAFIGDPPNVTDVAPFTQMFA